MISLNINLDIGLDELKPEYLPYVDWNKISGHQMVSSLSTSHCMYASVSRIMEAWPNNTVAGLSDEELLSIVAREVDKVYPLGGNSNSNYQPEYRLERFLNFFVDKDFLKKYYRQILSMYMLRKVNQTLVNSAPRMTSFFVMHGFLPLNEMVGVPLYTLDWNIVNSNAISLQRRYDILRSGSYLAYAIIYDMELTEFAVVLKTKELKSIIGDAPYVFDRDAITTCGSPYRHKDHCTEVSWDTLIDLYYSGGIGYSLIQEYWAYYVRNIHSSYEDLDRRIGDKLPGKTIFSEGDFK